MKTLFRRLKRNSVFTRSIKLPFTKMIPKMSTRDRFVPLHCKHSVHPTDAHSPSFLSIEVLNLFYNGLVQDYTQSYFHLLLFPWPSSTGKLNGIILSFSPLSHVFLTNQGECPIVNKRFKTVELLGYQLIFVASAVIR